MSSNRVGGTSTSCSSVTSAVLLGTSAPGTAPLGGARGAFLPAKILVNQLPFLSPASAGSICSERPKPRTSSFSSLPAGWTAHERIAWRGVYRWRAGSDSCVEQRKRR